MITRAVRLPVLVILTILSVFLLDPRKSDPTPPPHRPEAVVTPSTAVNAPSVVKSARLTGETNSIFHAPPLAGPAGDPLINPQNQLGQPEVEPASAELAERKASEARVIAGAMGRRQRVRAWLETQPADQREMWRSSAFITDVIDGQPVFSADNNREAAISTAADRVRGVGRYNFVRGDGIAIGVWERGGGALSHTRWNGRVNYLDNSTLGGSQHAAHVTGTLIASVLGDAADGMAPLANVRLYTATLNPWDMTPGTAEDLTEMLNEAAASAADFNNGKILISNHSYGPRVGWDARGWTGSPVASGATWFGSAWAAGAEDERFGIYSAKVSDTDDLCFSRPYYLPFMSAGNNRTDRAPAAGTTVLHRSGGIVITTTYDPAIHPPAVSAVEGGYDSLQTDSGVPKNVMSVGAVGDAILDLRGLPPPLTGGVSRFPSAATMEPYSNWGPADDGRVKPDIVANGADVRSTNNASNGYITFSGTSMSSPNACGSAALLVSFYRSLFPAGLMRAATLKGLILHTADDLGNAGPDYQFGWGLMNTEAAADLIQRHADHPGNGHLFENTLTGSSPHEFTFSWDESGPLRITLCYTDRAGAVKTTVDNRAPDLVNDLDIELSGPGGRTWRPWRLDPLNPAALATTGDNDVDNVKQIFVADPAPGPYVLTLRADGPLTGGSQAYSLLRSGNLPVASVPVPQTVTAARSYRQDFTDEAPLAAGGWNYAATGNGRMTHLSGGITLDTSTAGFALSTATLHADLSAFTPASTLTLEVDWRDLSDESHTLPATHNGLGTGDGISVSANGVTWYRIADFHSNIPSAILQTAKVNLDTAMPALGISFNSNFRIRLSQYDDSSSPGDGIRIESVRLFHRSPGRFEMAYAQLEEERSTGAASARVLREEGSQGTATVAYFTRPVTAVAGTDFVSKSGTLTLTEGQTFADFSVGLLSNSAAHGPRIFEIILTTPGGGATLDEQRKASTVVIEDDDEGSLLQSDPALLRPTVVHGTLAASQIVRAWNTNGYGRKQFAASTTTPWISVAPGFQGDAIQPARFRIDYNLAGMPPGRYAGSVTLQQITAPASSLEVPVVLDIGYAGGSAIYATGHTPADIPVDGPVTLRGPASRYPMFITASALSGRISTVLLGFDNLIHSNPADLDMVLQAPDGKSALVLSDAARRTATPTALDIVLDDHAPAFVPPAGAGDLTGQYRPANYTGETDILPSPAPQTPGLYLSDLMGGRTAGVWKLFVHDDKEDDGGSISGAWIRVTTASLSDGMYETIKPANSFELGGQSLLFTPEDSAEGYVTGRCATGGLPSVSFGSVVDPPANGYSTIALNSEAVAFYGQKYRTLGIGDNGDIVFGPPPGGSGEASLSNFLALPRLAALFGDLTRGSGSIHFQQLPDRVAVTWAKVIESSTGAQVTFRVELFFDGRIRMTWDPASPLSGITGISRGWGTSSYATQTVFATLPGPSLEIRNFTLQPGGSCSITWSSVPDFSYTVEWSTNLQTWHSFAPGPAGLGEITTRTFTDPSIASQLFLRVRKTAQF